MTASKHRYLEQAGPSGVNQRSKKSHKEISHVGKKQGRMCTGQIKKICPERGKNPPPENQQEQPFRMSQIPVPQSNGQLPPTCSAFCLSAWWSVAAPQEGHQETGSHTGLAAAVPGCIPVARPGGYLGRERSKCSETSPVKQLKAKPFQETCPGHLLCLATENME